MTKYVQIENLAAETENDPRWFSVVKRDGAADGTFFYAVKTTGVYCRPSCGARLARPENVAFFASPTTAETAGFRACKRCLPAALSRAELNSSNIRKACRFIEDSDAMPSLVEIAEHLEMSVFHATAVLAALAEDQGGGEIG